MASLEAMLAEIQQGTQPVPAPTAADAGCYGHAGDHG